MKKDNLFLYYTKKFKFQILISQIVWIIKSIPIWLIPLVAGYIINILTSVNDNVQNKIALVMIITSVLIISNIVFQYLQVKIQSSILRKIENALREDILKSLLFNESREVYKFEMGDYINLVSIDMENIYTFFKTIYTIIIPSIINIFISFVIVFMKSKIVSFFYLISIPICILLNYFTKKRIKSILGQGTIHKDKVIQKSCDLYNIHSYIKTHSLENIEYDDMSSTLHKYCLFFHKADVISATYSSVGWISFQLLSLLCIFIGASLALNKIISIGEIATYQVIFSMLMNQVILILNSYTDVIKGSISLKNLELFLQKFPNDSMPIKQHIEEIESVSFNKVSFGYKEKNIILDMSFRLTRGNVYYIIGKSGSGKTTLLNILLGIFKPIKGNILVNETNIADINIYGYRQKIAFLEQNNILFNGRLRDNITRYNLFIDEKDIVDYLKLFNLEDLIPKLYSELNINELGLSGGQIQRICIIRELLKKSDIYIFDEPTSSLDKNLKQKIINVIKTKKTNSIVLIVTHDISLIEENDNIINLDKRMSSYDIF